MIEQEVVREELKLNQIRSVQKLESNTNIVEINQIQA
jgi:hypothetical protein